MRAMALRCRDTPVGLLQGCWLQSQHSYRFRQTGHMAVLRMSATIGDWGVTLIKCCV
jgi:hypothetical protein